ncbi:MAG: hypothetical protein ACREDY_01295, partial [Bradyrhizobium sp.]
MRRIAVAVLGATLAMMVAAPVTTAAAAHKPSPKPSVRKPSPKPSARKPSPRLSGRHRHQHSKSPILRPVATMPTPTRNCPG